MGNAPDARGKPAYNSTPSTVGDFVAAVDWADKVGAGLRGTAAERALLTSDQIEVGQFFTETDTGSVYKRSSSGWDLIWNDTGWITLTLSSGWSAEDGDVAQYRIRAGVVYFRGRLNATTAASTQPFTAPLPVGARPSREQAVLLGTTGGAGVSFVMTVTTAGVVIVYKGANAVLALALAGFGAMVVT